MDESIYKMHESIIKPRNGKRYRDYFLSFDIALNDPTLSNFDPKLSYEFSVGTKNPLSGYDSAGRFKYYWISNYQGNVRINNGGSDKVNLYYTIIGSGFDVVDENNNVINGIYSCGSSGDVYPKQPATISLLQDEQLIFTCYKNKNSINTKEKKLPLLPGIPGRYPKPPPSTVNKKKISAAKDEKYILIYPGDEYLDNIGTLNEMSINSAINVNPCSWVQEFNVDDSAQMRITPGTEKIDGANTTPTPNNKLLFLLSPNKILPDNTKNKGQILSIDNTLKEPGFTLVSFADGSDYKHSGGSYIIKDNKYIPQNGAKNCVLLIVENI
jgi:hypothetical protein